MENKIYKTLKDMEMERAINGTFGKYPSDCEYIFIPKGSTLIYIKEGEYSTLIFKYKDQIVSMSSSSKEEYIEIYK